MKKTADLSLLALLCALAASPAVAFPENQAAEKPKPPAQAAPETPPAPKAWQEIPASAATEAKGAAALEDREWLVDENGQQYSILKFPKNRSHEKLENGRLRIVGGAVFEILGEDDKSFDLKVMRPVPGKPSEVRGRAEPSREQLAAADATYPAPPPESDRLSLGRFDKGMPTRGHWRNGFDIADLNGDGKLDFMQGPPRKGGDQPRLYLGDGAGGWRAAQVNAPPGLLDYGDLRVADLDGDKKLDIAMGVHLRGVIVLKGDGKGGFTPLPAGNGLDFTVPKIGAAAPSFSARRIELVDWNRDGRLDILAYSEGPSSALAASQGASSAVANELERNEENAIRGPRIYLNQGSGKWKIAASPGAAKDLFGDDLAVADFDGDGKSDFVLSANVMSRDNLIFMNAPANGGFANLSLETRPRGYSRGVATGDWNGDGRVDVAISYVNFELGVKRSGVDLFYREADGTWRREPLTAKAGRNVLEALAAGDVDGDGHADIAGLDHDGGLSLFLGDGTGKFSFESSPEAQKPVGLCRGYGLRLVDLDGDKRDEIVATFADEPVALHEPDRCPNNGGVAVFKSASGTPPGSAAAN